MSIKHIIAIVISLCILVALAACGNGNSPDTQEGNISDNGMSYMDYFAQISVGDTQEQVEDKMGFTGVVKIESDNIKQVFWDVENGNGVEVDFTSYTDWTASKIVLRYDSKDLVNDATKVTDLDGLGDLINNGLTYDDVKIWVGGTEGALVEKGTNIYEYYWRGSDNSSLHARFSTETDMLQSFTGFGN